MTFWQLVFLSFLSVSVVCSQNTVTLGITIADKLAGISKPDKTGNNSYPGLDLFNENIRELNKELQHLYVQAGVLFNLKDEKALQDLLVQINNVKKQIKEAQVLWANEMQQRTDYGEGYALWHQPDTNVYNLIADYGGDDKIYLIPENIGNIRISALSHFAVPKECHYECVSLILNRMGIIVREVSPWIRELSLNKDAPSVDGIYSDKKELALLSDTAFIGFVLSSRNMDVRADYKLLKKFVNSTALRIDITGGLLLLTGCVGEINDLLKIYDFVQSENIRQDYKIVPLTKIDAVEMMGMLRAAFRDDLSKDGEDNSSGLKVVPLSYQKRALFLSGSAAIVQKAVMLIKNLEDGIEDPTDKTVFWYNVKHSDPKELALVLSKVYEAMCVGGAHSIKADLSSLSNGSSDNTTLVSKDGVTKIGNFVADSQTGTLIMILEKEFLPKIKDLLKKLDIPKKMVKIEVLLFERKIANQHKAGLNLLRLGEEVCKSVDSSLSWNSAGILEFLLKGSTGLSLLPGYDLAYQFMMAQEDVRINASPSVVTLNQTPATIAIVEEMSIAVSADKDNKAQYNRAQYGITIKIVPIINIAESNDDGKCFITLETDITFDTTGKKTNDRPDVTRRHITNRVRIADGETVIIGGLRCKHSSESHDGIPFLGEIPGIGKLFGMNSTSDNQTEMFVFITPKIIDSPQEQKERQAEAFLVARPGETEDFRYAINIAEENAKELAKQKLLEDKKFATLPDSLCRGGEYDGR